MAYTVKELAKISGVSVRTLHYYDEIGLLKPLSKGANRYRYYEEQQLLHLQQILFFKELGFALSDIKKLLSQDDFDNIKALSTHRKILKDEIVRKNNLIATIDKTIGHLGKEATMSDKELYNGFDKAKQKEYEQYLINRFGDKMKNILHASKTKTANWSKDDWDNCNQEWDSICKDLATLLEKNMAIDASEVQNTIQRHHKWLPWTGQACTREAYAGLGQGYSGFEWKSAFIKYDAHHPRLANFMSEAMEFYANKNL